MKMEHLRIKVAGSVIEIQTIDRISPRLFRCFLSNEDPDLCVCLSQEEIRVIETFHDKSENMNGWAGKIRISYVLQQVSNALLDQNTLLFHGATIALHGYAYMFSAPSGVGKTTHIRKWLEHIPDVFVVNGDKPFVKFLKDGGLPLACGSPWAGKENMYTNTMVPLKSIILMERAEDNHIEQISFAEAFPSLLRQVYRPDDEGRMRKTLHLMQCLNPEVSFWRFQCNNLKDDCFDVAYNALVCDQK